MSTVDEDARLLSKRGQTVAGYNAHIAVDAHHQRMVAEEVAQDGNDLPPWAPMREKAQAVLPSDTLTGLADSGYDEGNPLKTCEDRNITVFVALPDKTKAIAAQGRFTREQFHYEAGEDRYVCPQGQALTASGKPHQKNGKWLQRYNSHASDCRACPLRGQCLGEKATTRPINRWEHAAVIERQRMALPPGRMKTRAALAEHPFGVIKQRAGMRHFLMRGLEKCRGEFSRMVLGYHFTRVLNLLGVEARRAYCAGRGVSPPLHVVYA